MKTFNILFALLTIYYSAFSQAPTITSFSPASGPVGTLVTISGTNLSSPTGFTIGGVAAIVVSNTGSTLVGMVMPGAMTGAVSVTTTGGAATASNFTVTPTAYPRYQQGPKLVGSGYVGGANVLQGAAVAISADGNTAIVGGLADSSYRGAAWIFTRSGSTWAQQGPKLIGTGAATTGAGQGNAVALSADGNSAIVGGNEDSSFRGSAWIFVRSGTSWAQQGPKLVGTGYLTNTYAVEQGTAVSISADGNTAVVGGKGDSMGTGAVWVFTRSGATWSQQGHKLVGSGAVSGPPNQGNSVSLSADGKTILVGGYNDNNGLGASWIFTDSGGIWVQQGPKLVGTGAVGGAQQGQSVSLSADGNTAIVGGANDSSRIGAAWVFTRSGSIWSQQGAKLVGTGAVGTFIYQGWSVALSADGNTALVGGFGDSSFYGATWVYLRSGGTWHQQSHKLVGTGGTAVPVWQGYAVSLSADGNTTLLGGSHDNNFTGAAWIFVNDAVGSCLSNASSFSHAICQGDTFTFGSRHLSSSGTFADTLTNVGGCDSILTLNLTVNPLPVVSLNWQTLVQEGHLHLGNGTLGTRLGDTIICRIAGSPPFAMTGGTPLGGVYSGANIQNDTFFYQNFHVETVFYTYTDSNGCIATAVDSFYDEECTGIQNIPAASTIHLYPNPNKGSFTLQTSGGIGSDYSISDMLGHIIMQRTIRSDNEMIELPDTAEGVYTLAVKGAQPVRFVVVR